MPLSLVRSDKSTTQTFVRFINKSNRSVTVIWIDFRGNFVPYKSLEHDQYIDVNTFLNHPWVFRDEKTRDLMHVKNKNIYYPSFVYCPTTGRLVRSRIYIHYPLLSLRKRALLTVKNLLKSEEYIRTLELPNELKRDLKLMFEYNKRDYYTILT